MIIQIGSADNPRPSLALADQQAGISSKNSITTSNPGIRAAQQSVDKVHLCKIVVLLRLDRQAGQI